MVQPTNLQATATFSSAEPIRATEQKWNGRVVSLDRLAGVGSASSNYTITQLFTNALLPLLAIFGAVFIATESLAIAGASTASTALIGLFLKHTCGL